METYSPYTLGIESFYSPVGLQGLIFYIDELEFKVPTDFEKTDFADLTEYSETFEESQNLVGITGWSTSTSIHQLQFLFLNSTCVDEVYAAREA